MRIGLFTYSTQPRGSVVHSASLAEALWDQGHDVTLFALSKEGTGLFRELRCKLCLIPAGTAPAELDLLIAQRIDEFVQGLERLKPELDLMHAQDCLAASALLEARRRLGPRFAACPLVRTVHHVEQFESQYLAHCQRRSILEADHVLSVSELTASEVLRQFGRQSERVDNGVDLARFDPGWHGAERGAPRRSKSESRRVLGVATGALLVLSVGGVEARKNSLRCLRAMARVCADNPRAEWLIVGGASVLDHRAYQERFEAQLAELDPQVRRRIRRLGTVSEVTLTDLYLSSDVLACPSEQEGWGLCVLEAMASGVPVVVPRQAPFLEYLTEQSARFVDPLDAGDIERAIVELLHDPGQRARLGGAGRHVAERFSWARSARRHGELYGDITKHASGRKPGAAAAQASA